MRLVIEVNLLEVDDELSEKARDTAMAAVLHDLAEKIGSQYGIEGVNCLPLYSPTGLPIGGVWLSE